MTDAAAMRAAMERSCGSPAGKLSALMRYPADSTRMLPRAYGAVPSGFGVIAQGSDGRKGMPIRGFPIISSRPRQTSRSHLWASGYPPPDIAVCSGKQSLSDIGRRIPEGGF